MDASNASGHRARPVAVAEWHNLLQKAVDRSIAASESRAIDLVPVSTRGGLSPIEPDLSTANPFRDRRRACVELEGCHHGFRK
jgi:hypothetical protein